MRGQIKKNVAEGSDGGRLGQGAQRSAAAQFQFEMMTIIGDHRMDGGELEVVSEGI